ncbi:MAG: Wzz/FepE/Etk N-terminal domain-containing protein, partial [Pirellulaceae bacterium]
MRGIGFAKRMDFARIVDEIPKLAPPQKAGWIRNRSLNMEKVGMLQAAANSMGMGDSPMAPQGQPDLIQMLWRWKWLSFLGALLGIGVGYLFFLQIAPTYKAMATLQIISPQDDLLPLRSLETGLATGAGNRADEIRVITSSAVLSNAVEI